MNEAHDLAFSRGKCPHCLDDIICTGIGGGPVDGEFVAKTVGEGELASSAPAIRCEHSAGNAVHPHSGFVGLMRQIIGSSPHDHRRFADQVGGILAVVDAAEEVAEKGDRLGIESRGDASARGLR